MIPTEKAKKNPVFAGLSEMEFEICSVNHNGSSHIPIIPLTGSAVDEIYPLEWSVLKMSGQELETLRNQINKRTKGVVDRLLDQYIDSSFPRRMAKTIAWIKRGKMVDAAMKKITDELKEFDLLT